jgi:hypothetical protein
VDLALKSFLGGISLVRGDHLDESEAARVLGMGIAHDVALLDLTVLLEETRDLFLRERGVDARDEEVGARVDAVVFLAVALAVAVVGRRAAAARVSTGARQR